MGFVKIAQKIAAKKIIFELTFSMTSFGRCGIVGLKGKEPALQQQTSAARSLGAAKPRDFGPKFSALHIPRGLQILGGNE